MCEVLDRVEARGIQFGKLELAQQLVSDGSITKEKAAALMHYSVEEFERQLREHKLPPQ